MCKRMGFENEKEGRLCGEKISCCGVQNPVFAGWSVTGG